MSFRHPVTGHDEPIEPSDAHSRPMGAHGTVLDFETLKVKHGNGKRWNKPCEHNKLVYDPAEKRVWCEECESTVDNFDAFMRLTRDLQLHLSEIRSRYEALEKDEKQNLISRAAKAVDRAFRRRNTVPVCPHCHEGLLPEDMLNLEKGGAISRDLLRRKRMKQKEETKNSEAGEYVE